MARSAADHLRDILDAIEAIARYTRGGQAAFDREPMISGMRDRLAHRYATLDKALIWAVVEHNLPKLRDAVNALLSRR